ncbi:LOW QUALITY PROTEIN: ATP-dependent DNA helicase pif1-like [Athalia rosae]|uniref:LOW QUALITY PROTEIN: ATP-dependent DNA helicase pif1-like n=1 Tax=Athalia rosae TaxID=37344 RepID=UPI002033FDD1|nr:LOW QUALITY PROTEIN: ATP-dependent DNA helicase pif1-like [Athalia rosae]
MSFEHLRTVNGVIFQTYQSACKELGLLEGDEHWQKTMSDAVISEPATKLRELFTIILIFCQPSDPLDLWNKFRNDLCGDLLNRMRNENQDMTLAYSDDIYNVGLIIIEDKIHEICDKSLTDFGFLHQKGTIHIIIWIRGTGKTFITNLILAKVRSQGKLALAVASSGIAATLLAGGRTAHSTFKLPLTVSLQQDSVCSIRKNGPLEKVLQDVSLIIWDECTMIHRAHVEALDRTLRDIRSCDKIMGGITVMFAGDFRQTLPVIVRGTRADIVKSCLKSSPLWKFVHTLKLSTNMRAHLVGGSTNFSSKLLLIGDGKVPHFENKIEIDRDLGERVTSIEELISKVYPNIVEIENKDYQWMCQRAILAARNSSVDDINNQILTKLPGDTVTYTSIDNVMDPEDAVHYPQEFLNSLNPSGLPPHSLKLKIGAPIILLRNLKPPNLCNGTRLQVKFLRDNVIVAIVLTGPAVGANV